MKMAVILTEFREEQQMEGTMRGCTAEMMSYRDCIAGVVVAEVIAAATKNKSTRWFERRVGRESKLEHMLMLNKNGMEVVCYRGNAKRTGMNCSC
ncbi:hypothetical protein C5167_033221 [Papaver somniferum]|uniref:Uncharacterized protein n=1 Tax=Papaver somniferum TaxID=3469 RepID=A0A4Y7KDT1_PAPSO|nr:hypothetical protein C5167_033221 [Papaver somniferum]